MVLSLVTTTPILLGKGRLAQFQMLICLLAQSVSTFVVMAIYSDALRQSTSDYVWWPVLDLLRVAVMSMLRVDRLIRTEPNLFSDRSLFRTVAVLNGIGMFWAFPMWLFYASFSLKDDEVSSVLFVVTMTFIALHIISSIPSLSKMVQIISVELRRFEINNNIDEHAAYSFMASASIQNDQLLPASPQNDDHTQFQVIQSDDHEVDPIMFTAPIHERKPMMESMEQLQLRDHQNDNAPNDRLFDEESSDITAHSASDEVGDEPIVDTQISDHRDKMDSDLEFNSSS